MSNRRKNSIFAAKKSTKMQQNHTKSSEINAMLIGGVFRMYFDALSSINEHGTASINNYKQSCSNDFECRSFTGKERDEETGYGYFGARYMDHGLLTSFISVDRYASKYPSISPYAYCAWNPIRLTDPTGDTICINGQHYTPGMSSDGLDEFSKKAVDALNTMYRTDEGRSLIDNLGSSDNIFTIEEAATSEFKPIDRRRASLAQLKTDLYGQKEYQGLLDIGFDFNGGSGGTILWNSAGSILPTEEGGKVCATTDLAHEMFHALDANLGLLDHRDEKGIPRKEWQAVYRENILRGQMGLPLRTHYRKQMTSNGEFVGGRGEMMISGGKPIKPSWY